MMERKADKLHSCTAPRDRRKPRTSCRRSSSGVEQPANSTAVQREHVAVPHRYNLCIDTSGTSPVPIHARAFFHWCTPAREDPPLSISEGERRRS